MLLLIHVTFGLIRNFIINIPRILSCHHTKHAIDVVGGKWGVLLISSALYHAKFVITGKNLRIIHPRIQFLPDMGVVRIVCKINYDDVPCLMEYNSAYYIVNPLMSTVNRGGGGGGGMGEGELARKVVSLR